MKYKLPIKGSTTDVLVYSKAWKDLAAPLVSVTGYSCVSFDPTLRFSNADDTKTFELTPQLAKALGDAITEKTCA